MSYPQGALLPAPATNGSPQAKYGTHIDYLGVGGLRTVPTLADRDAIVTKDVLEYDGLGSGMRRNLMMVAVAETEQAYILYIPNFSNLADAQRLGALRDNANWMELGLFLNLKTGNPGAALTQDEVEAIKAANNPSALNTFVTERELQAALASFSGHTTGGDSVTSFSQAAGKFTLVTSGKTFEADLNVPVNIYTGPQVLRDAEFNLAITDQSDPNANSALGWVKYGNWQSVGGQAVSSPGITSYLKQDTSAPPGLYEVAYKVASIGNRPIVFYNRATDGTEVHIYYSGEYKHYVQAPGGGYHFELYCEGDVVLDYLRMTPVQLGRLYGDDRFVHLSGDEAIGGSKTFTGRVNFNAFTSSIRMSDNGGDIYYRSNGVSATNTPFSIYAENAGVSLYSRDASLSLGTGGYGGPPISVLLSSRGNVGINTSTPTELLDVNGNVKAQQFIGDGSRLTNLPAAGVRLVNVPVFSASTAGVQTIDLGAPASGLVSVTLLEAGSTTLTRTIWEPFCSVSGSTLIVAADAQVVSGDLILVKYTL